MSATDMPFERLEALLRGDEPRTLEEKERASLLSELRAGALAAPDTLRESILATAPAVQRQRIRRPSRRLVLVVVPVAVALAVGAALVHGFVSGGSNGVATGVYALHQNARLSPVTAKSPATGGKTLHQAVAHGTTSYSAVGNAVVQRSAVDSASSEEALGAFKGDKLGGTPGTIAIPTDRLVHADASIVVQVRTHAALSRATNKATEIVNKLGGYAQNVQYRATRSGSGDAFLALRVPVKKAQTAITQLGSLGMLASEEVQTQDLQRQFDQQTNRLGSLQRAIAVYQKALNSGTLTGTERVQIQIKLANAEHTLLAVRKQRSGTVASASMADISLTLTTNKNAIVPGRHHHNGGSGFTRRLGDAAHFLGLEGIYVLYALVLLSPFILLGALGWGLLRERRRRDEKRLLASA
jgi:uncharacterized protein DUF4349